MPGKSPKKNLGPKNKLANAQLNGCPTHSEAAGWAVRVKAVVEPDKIVVRFALTIYPYSLGQKERTA